jgi:hypothetical protein
VFAGIGYNGCRYRELIRIGGRVVRQRFAKPYMRNHAVVQFHVYPPFLFAGLAYWGACFASNEEVGVRST